MYRIASASRLMTTKNLETVSGLVELINAKQTGIKVAGQWLNISAYHAVADLPKLDQRVDVQVEKTDRGMWIQSVEVLDDGQIHQLPAQQRRGGGGGGRTPAELRDIRRLPCSKPRPRSAPPDPTSSPQKSCGSPNAGSPGSSSLV